MLLVCPNCATSYQVDPAAFGAAGRSVRCVRCRNMWFASNPQAMAAIAYAHRQDLADLVAAPSIADPAAAGASAAELPAVPEAPSIDPTVAAAVASEPQPGADPYDELPPAAEIADNAVAPALEPTEVVPSPPLAPLPPGEPPPAIEASPSADVESVAARRIRRKAARRRLYWTGQGLPTLILLLLAANIGLIAWRADIVQWFPQTASLYAALGLPVNLRGLAFTDIVTRKDMEDGVQVLIVEGFIRNETRRSAQVPRLRFAVRNDSGHEIYSWTAQPARSAIPSGATLPFRSRLASPPPETHEILVRFYTRRDLVAGIK
jgi:predicted Zn finger-like uncharacterized protein